MQNQSNLHKKEFGVNYSDENLYTQIENMQLLTSASKMNSNTQAVPECNSTKEVCIEVDMVSHKRVAKEGICYNMVGQFTLISISFTTVQTVRDLDSHTQAYIQVGTH